MSARKLDTVCQATGTITITVEKYNNMLSAYDVMYKGYMLSLESNRTLLAAVTNLHNRLNNSTPREIKPNQKVVALWPKQQ